MWLKSYCEGLKVSEKKQHTDSGENSDLKILLNRARPEGWI